EASKSKVSAERLLVALVNPAPVLHPPWPVVPAVISERPLIQHAQMNRLRCPAPDAGGAHIGGFGFPLIEADPDGQNVHQCTVLIWAYCSRSIARKMRRGFVQSRLSRNISAKSCLCSAMPFFSSLHRMR